jgi:hypothetical protein
MGPSSVRVATAIAAISMALSVSRALAQVSSGDATATRIYLQESLTEARAGVRDLPAGFAAIEALRGRLQAECPDVLAGEPKPVPGATPSASATEIEQEERAAVFGVAEHTEYRRLLRSARAVSRLSWSDPALTRLVHSSAEEEVAHAAVPTPGLCADMRIWVSSGYQTVSAATEAYAHRESILSAEIEGDEKAILHKLKRYEDQADRRIVQQIAELEKRVLRVALPKIFAALAKVGEVLHGPAATPAG